VVAYPLKAMADEALLECPTVESCIVVSVPRTGRYGAGPRLLYHEEMRADDISRSCDIEWMDSETRSSSSTLQLDRQAEGCAPHHGGYLVYTTMTMKYTFDYHEDDVFFCTATSAGSPAQLRRLRRLSLGATSVMFEGVPNYPNPGGSGDGGQARHQPVLHGPTPSARS